MSRSAPKMALKWLKIAIYPKTWPHVCQRNHKHQTPQQQQQHQHHQAQHQQQCQLHHHPNRPNINANISNSNDNISTNTTTHHPCQPHDHQQQHLHVQYMQVIVDCTPLSNQTICLIYSARPSKHAIINAMYTAIFKLWPSSFKGGWRHGA